MRDKTLKDKFSKEWELVRSAGAKACATCTARFVYSLCLDMTAKKSCPGIKARTDAMLKAREEK